MSTPITVVAIIEGKPGTGPQIDAAMHVCTSETRGEAGCISYVPMRALDTADTKVFVECWTSLSDLDAHLQMPHTKTLTATLETLGASLQVIKLEPLD